MKRTLLKAQDLLTAFDEITAPDIKPVMLMTLILMQDRKQHRVGELADRAGVTQQAMGKTLRMMNSVGLIDITVNGDDKRARSNQLTRRGERVLNDFLTTYEAN